MVPAGMLYWSASNANSLHARCLTSETEVCIFEHVWTQNAPLCTCLEVNKLLTGDGRVLLYDLMQNSEHPSKVLDVCGTPAPVFDLAFNSKAPELFATTDQQSVKVSETTLALQLCIGMQCSIALLWIDA